MLLVAWFGTGLVARTFIGKRGNSSCQRVDELFKTIAWLLLPGAKRSGQDAVLRAAAHAMHGKPPRLERDFEAGREYARVRWALHGDARVVDLADVVKDRDQHIAAVFVLHDVLLFAG
ncbi:hypothetical protein THIX_90008 [Thiomonas sp. X19]|nr:hypothetical protein THIX_90008 [Thiomonas sp. X19]